MSTSLCLFFTACFSSLPIAWTSALKALALNPLTTKVWFRARNVTSASTTLRVFEKITFASKVRFGAKIRWIFSNLRAALPFS